MKILLAEHSPSLRGRILELLSTFEKVPDIIHSNNVQEATEDLERHRPEIIIFDYQLIGGNSLDILRQVQQKNHQSVITIVLAESPNQSVKQLCDREGATHIFDKSTELEKMIEVLRPARSETC